MNGKHNYKLSLQWTGNKGTGTSHYRAYERSFTIEVDGKVTLEGSADPTFRGDATRYNPEDWLLSALASCHLLSYLHVCAVAGVVVVDYTDLATGEMLTTSDGAGHFTEVTLHPVVTVLEASMVDQAKELHAKANALCFIANSVNFPVHHQAVIKVAGK